MSKTPPSRVAQDGGPGADDVADPSVLHFAQGRGGG